jgi:hypothetical protein
MSAQQDLPLPSPAASNTVIINAHCSLPLEAAQRVIVVAGLPVLHYCAEDAASEAHGMVSLVESGFAQQTEVARAFGRSVRTVRRHQRPGAAVVIPTKAGCAMLAGFAAPISLRIAISLTPSRCAIARLLIPWFFTLCAVIRSLGNSPLNRHGQRLTFKQQMWTLKADRRMPRDRWIYEEPFLVGDGPQALALVGDKGSARLVRTNFRPLKLTENEKSCILAAVARISVL